MHTWYYVMSVLVGTPPMICLTSPTAIRRQSTRSLTDTRWSSKTMRLSHTNGTSLGNYRTFSVYVHRCTRLFFWLIILPSQVFKDATLFFSHGGTPNVASVIPAMDHLDKHLASIATSPKYGWAIKAAIALGKKTLNRYYDCTDHSEVYQIVMSMFPFFSPIL